MTNILKTIKLNSSKDGKISLANLTRPYGLGSDDVLSIGICLKDENPEWSVHIPYENLPDLILALSEISQSLSSKDKRN